MNAKPDNIFVDEQIFEYLKEKNPEKLAEIKEKAKELGYNSVLDYLLSASELYRGLHEETKKGRVVHILIKEHGTLEKILGGMGNTDRVIRLNVKGLEYKTNGNKTAEYSGK